MEATRANAMRGRICVVTGSTDGIGMHTAERLVRSGAKVFLHGRNEYKAKEAAEALAKKTGVESSRIDVLHADLSSLEEVKQMSESLREKCDRVDVLVHNAGVYAPVRSIGKDGYELTWSVNVLSAYALTCRILDLILKGNHPRVVMASSISQGGAREEHVRHVLRDPHGDASTSYDPHVAYAVSKLSNAMMAVEMSQRLRGLACVNSLDPGTVNTKMLLSGWGPIGIDVSKADSEYYLATDPKVNGITGKYFVNDRESRASSLVYDVGLRSEMWSLWERQTDVSFRVPDTGH